MTFSLLLDHIKDPHASWSCGRFGAIAEFHRDADEPMELVIGTTSISAATRRGAIRIKALPSLRPVAYETISKCIESWGQGVALCLPREEAVMSGRTSVTELGPDEEAVRAVDRDAVLFDLGLGGAQAEICVRSADPETIALLRGACGRPLLDQPHVLHRMPALSPHRVFCSRLGRVEVYQPVPPPDGKSPDGPHTHVLPRLLANGLDHAATVPVPDGWLAGMSLYPAHPLLTAHGERRTFDRTRYAAFQDLMTVYGDPSLMAGKRAAFAGAAVAGEGMPGDRREAIGFRIGQRQAKWLQTDAPETIAAKS